jgi:hypothetical protein
MLAGPGAKAGHSVFVKRQRPHLAGLLKSFEFYLTALPAIVAGDVPRTRVKASRVSSWPWAEESRFWGCVLRTGLGQHLAQLGFRLRRLACRFPLGHGESCGDAGGRIKSLWPFPYLQTMMQVLSFVPVELPRPSLHVVSSLCFPYEVLWAAPPSGIRWQDFF